MFLKENIHRFISSTELFLSNIRGVRYTGFKKVNFFVGHPVGVTGKVIMKYAHYIVFNFDDNERIFIRRHCIKVVLFCSFFATVLIWVKMLMNESIFTL